MTKESQKAVIETQENNYNNRNETRDKKLTIREKIITYLWS